MSNGLLVPFHWNLEILLKSFQSTSPEKPSTEVLCPWTTAAVSRALSFEHKPFKLVVKFLALRELSSLNCFIT